MMHRSKTKMVYAKVHVRLNYISCGLHNLRCPYTILQFSLYSGPHERRRKISNKTGNYFPATWETHHSQMLRPIYWAWRVKICTKINKLNKGAFNMYVLHINILYFQYFHGRLNSGHKIWQYTIPSILYTYVGTM